MGYYSRFTIEIVPNDPSVHYDTDWLDVLEKHSGGYEFEEWDGKFFAHDAKWYSWLPDASGMSFAYPDCIFYVTQEGEDGEGRRLALRAGVVVQDWKRDWVQK